MDIYNGGRPKYPTTTNQAFAGLCGPWIRPLAYRHVAQMAMKIPGVQIAGGGGLIPVLAVAVIYDPLVEPKEQSFDEGLSKLIALLMRLLLPLSLLVLVIYLSRVPVLR